jgi:hypothetical protein
MPYIENQERRKELNRIVDFMLSLDVKLTGELNYILFKFCKVRIPASYNNYKNYLGELHECEEEIRRRFMVEHEKRKIEENGDVE